MSNAPIKNAGKIIERFGGIRPMASKTGIAVTTIQGWKKRDAIPAKRASDIIKAAQANDVELSSLMNTGGANNNVKAKDESSADEAVVLEAEIIDEPVSSKKADQPEDKKVEELSALHSNAEHAPDDGADIKEQLAEMEKRAVKKSVIISAILVLVVLGGAAALVWPKAKDMNDNVTQNGEKIAAMEENSAGGIDAKVTDFLPQSWQNQLSGITEQAQDLKQQAVELKDQAVQIKDQASAALVKVEEISKDVLSTDAGNLEQRVAKLETHLGEVMATPEMSYFMEQLNAMGASVPGTETLGGAQSQLNELLAGFSGTPDQLDGYLNQARQQSAVLGQTFENVPADDMKAAALLFTLNQFRGALNRDGQPFDEDLTLFRNFIGVEDPALNAALNKLAPSAEQGVLTVGGLGEELQNLASEVVEASLKGENVSIEEKAKARFNDLFSVERDGELVTGTETQGSLKKINTLLEAGDLDAAILQAQNLEGPEAEVVAPWIAKAQKTKAAQDVINVLDQNIDFHTNSEGVSAIDAKKKMSNGNMIIDPKSGLQILIPSKTRSNSSITP